MYNWFSCVFLLRHAVACKEFTLKQNWIIFVVVMSFKLLRSKKVLYSFDTKVKWKIYPRLMAKTKQFCYCECDPSILYSFSLVHPFARRSHYLIIIFWGSVIAIKTTRDKIWLFRNICTVLEFRKSTGIFLVRYMIQIFFMLFRQFKK